METLAATTALLPFCSAPDRDPDQYGSNANINQTRCSLQVDDFFRVAFRYAKYLHRRQVELEEELWDDALSMSRREELWSQAGREEAQYLRSLRPSESREHYYTWGMCVQSAASGQVMLVKRKGMDSGQVYAMKKIREEEMVEKIQLERSSHADQDSSWVVRLCAIFQDGGGYHMLTEYQAGGDLMRLMIKHECFSEDIIRFYISELILAIEDLHRRGFIHCDIKPDDILLDRRGHIKLTDFGMSAVYPCLMYNGCYQYFSRRQPSNHQFLPNDCSPLSSRINQIEKTISNRTLINGWRLERRQMAESIRRLRDYDAPEVVSGQGHAFECDWWSLGAIMYEMLLGWPPFCSDEKEDTCRKILDWKYSLTFAEDMTSPESESLIRSLMCDRETRLGRHGAQEVKDDEFFRGVDFSGLINIRAPYEPRPNKVTQEDEAKGLAEEVREAQAAREAQAQEIPEMAWRATV